MQQTILPIESIQERDVDLILLEEFSTDVSFCEWFIQELDLPHLTAVNGAWRSISDFGLGETDILFSYRSNDQKIVVLIENKLDTSFQNEQYNRYLKRANEYVSSKDCDQAYVILIAPKLYCENQNEFESYLTYESIAERFEFVGSIRNLFKSKLMQIGIEKLRRGYQPVNSVPVQKFWGSYWNYKQAHYPGLIMKKPGIVPHNSDWPMLFDERLKGIVFYHKLAQGNADATFKGFSDVVEHQIKGMLPEWARLVKHSKSFSMRVTCEPVDRTRNFESQVERVAKGLDSLERLRGWLTANRKMIFR